MSRKIFLDLVTQLPYNTTKARIIWPTYKEILYGQVYR